MHGTAQYGGDYVDNYASAWGLLVMMMMMMMQGDHKPGKPGVLRDFYKHGKLREFCATSGKIFNRQK